MKFLIIVDDYADGAGNIAQILSIHLRDDGNEVSMLLTYKHNEPRYDLTGIQQFDINMSAIIGPKLFKLKKQVHATAEIIRKSACDIVISFINNNNTIACNAVKQTDIPIVVSERSNPLVIYPNWRWRILRKSAYKRADVISVQFDAFMKFENGFFEQKCMVTHNIIQKPPVKKSEWNNKRVSFVSLGRYSEIKRFDLMIELFSVACRSYDMCELHIYGSRIPNEELMRMITNNLMEDKIFLHDAVKNVHEELSHHDVYLMTSYQEGFPNALSEALAVGLPAVVFKCHDGIAELVQNGVNGFCVAEGDSVAFVQGIEKLSSSLSMRVEYGEKSIEIAEKYNETEIMKEWYACIERAVSNRQHS